MRNFLIASAMTLSLCLPTTAAAQDDTAAPVLAVVDGFMDALGNKDAETMSALVTDPGFVAFVQSRADGDRVGLRTMESVIAGLAQVDAEISEPYWDPQVLVEGPVAMVWAPYAFMVDGQLSHCGIDIFNLMQIHGEWRIASVTYSARTDNCGAPE